MFKRLNILATVLLLSGCAMAPIDPSNLTSLRPSDLLKDPDRYDGQHVVVTGYVVIKPERRIIVDSESEVGKNGDVCLGLDGPRKYFSSFYSKKMKVSGTFKKNLCGKDDVCLYWCGDAGIILDDAT